MARYRLTHAAQADIVSILAWSHEQFGEEARKRYETLIAAAIQDAAIQDAATHGDEVRRVLRPELGEGVFSWHLARSGTGTPGERVHRPRHFLICRRDGDVMVVGRVLHDAMELRRHLDPQEVVASRSVNGTVVDPQLHVVEVTAGPGPQ